MINQTIQEKQAQKHPISEWNKKQAAAAAVISTIYNIVRFIEGSS
jgi:hypothetical protein